MMIEVNSPETLPYKVAEPATQSLPFIFNSPHSGRHYPSSFLESSRLDKHMIRRSEDLYVDELFSDMPLKGAPLLCAQFPRAYLDVNREPYELDPKMFEGSLPSYANIRSIRVACGLGTIARVVAEAQEIYKHRLPVEEALYRIEKLYKPYHRQLRQLMAQTRALHTNAFLIDCHSMPSGDDGAGNGSRPDFVVGDRYGTSCAPALTETIAASLSDLGYNVSRNRPYAGGFITEHYGRPGAGLHALQLEINRGLYANEADFTKNSHFQILKNDLNAVFEQAFESTADFATKTDRDLPLAAE